MLMKYNNQLQRKLNKSNLKITIVSVLARPTNTTRMSAVITLWVSIKVKDHHLHHDLQWLSDITPHWHHHLLKTGVDEYMKICSKLRRNHSPPVPLSISSSKSSIMFLTSKLLPGLNLFNVHEGTWSSFSQLPSPILWIKVTQKHEMLWHWSKEGSLLEIDCIWCMLWLPQIVSQLNGLDLSTCQLLHANKICWYFCVCLGEQHAAYLPRTSRTS